jgi:hypothetical protein
MKRPDAKRSWTAGAALAASLLLALVALAPVSAKDENPARALIEKSVDASGGMAKLTGWTTRIDTGHLKAEWPGWGELHANYTRWIRKPDGLKIDQDFSAFDHPFFFTYYFNKGEVWAVVNLGVRQNPAYTQRLTRAMETVDGIAYYLAQCDTFYIASEVPDDSLVASASIERVGVVDEGDTVFLDLDRKTHLLVRRIDDGGAFRVLYDDYREKDGVRLPYRVRTFQADGRTEEIVFEDYRIGEKIDDAVFEEYRPKPKE